ncbi:MAG TPA: hypothetical protein VH853_12350 [Polyangia bacterium]|jgi:peptidoglycan hydrolase CwlO-like protein|nr:hypothetical protein [Polyangia bacterium]
MSDRRENSVLFSLKELRRIEDDRVRVEQDELSARRESERAAKEAAERSAREAEERRQREEAERTRRAEEDHAAKSREDQMRLQEAERRARVEGEMRIHEERMRLEVQAKARNSPVKAVVTVALVIIAVAGGVTYRMYTQHQTELAAQQAALEAERVEAKKREAELESRLAGIQKDMNDKLANAKSEEERSRIRADAAQARAVAQSQQAHAKPTHGGSRSDPATPTKIKPNTTKRDISNDPLEGL